MSSDSERVPLQPPDPKAHRNVSLGKSALRMLAGLVLALGQLPLAGALLVLAEVLGVVEELV